MGFPIGGGTWARYFHEDATFKEDSTPAMGERRIVDLKDDIESGLWPASREYVGTGVWQC